MSVFHGLKTAVYH